MKKTFKILALCFALLVVFSSVCFATDVVTTSQEGAMPIAETSQRMRQLLYQILTLLFTKVTLMYYLMVMLMVTHF